MEDEQQQLSAEEIKRLREDRDEALAALGEATDVDLESEGPGEPNKIGNGSSCSFCGWQGGRTDARGQPLPAHHPDCLVPGVQRQAMIVKAKADQIEGVKDRVARRAIQAEALAALTSAEQHAGTRQYDSSIRMYLSDARARVRKMGCAL